MPPLAPAARPRHRAPLARALRALLLPLLAAGAGITCRDRSVTGPGLPAPARLALTPVLSLQAAPGGPALTLARLRVELRPVGGGAPLSQVVTFTGDSAVVQFEVLAAGAGTPYEVRVAATDAAGDTLFRGLDTLHAVPGRDVAPAAMPLAYAGPDAGVTDIAITPADTTLDAPDTLRLAASAVGAPATRLNVGWTSRDPVALAVSDAGTVRPRSMERDVWVVATLFTGVTDSVRVRVRAPVSAVILDRDTASVIRGDTLRLAAALRDSAGTPLAGRPVAWASLDPAAATVDTTGLVTAVAARTTARIVATSGARADTVVVATLPRPVAAVTATPDSLRLAVGATAALGAEVRDAAGALNPDWVVAWSSADTTVATVDAAGTVAARATGITVLRATAGGATDSVVVRVVPAGPEISHVVVTPDAATAFALGDTLAFSAQAFFDANPVATTYTWTSRDTTVAVVDAAGRVVARANGRAWIVAAEVTGTYADSAEVTVQQRVSSVTVTPGVVQRYLGTTQQFVASAVDGRGNPMPFATFAWSSTAAGTVSIDTLGLATMAALGTATVRATAGGIDGQASVTVVTPITRIVVSPDSVRMDALGATQAYTAVAYDTLNAPMTGVTFGWASSNPSVASLAAGAAVTATAQANGITRIRATAQGVTGEAVLTVQQVMTGIELSPGTATIAPGGRLLLLARGVDRNTRYLTTSPAFSFSSDSTQYATVDAGGVVTGVAVGTARVTARGGAGNAIVSNQVAVAVSNTGVPPVVTFGRDTIAIGRGTTSSIPVYLSVPNPNAATEVDFTVADTIAFFPQVRHTFPAGATAINVPLTGRNAGATRLFATPATAGYGGDTAVVTVQANVRFENTSLGMVATDQRTTRVLLSDPAPPGGVYVTFAHGTPGVADVSPDPAYIPAGLLAANVTVRGLAAGTSVIGLSAAGVTGANTLTASVSAARLGFYYGGPMRLGAGQYLPTANYVAIPQTLGAPLTVTLLSSDTTVGRLDPQVTIPTTTTIVGVSPRGLAPGTVTLTARAPGWQDGTIGLVVTTPRVGICCTYNLNTTSAPAGITVYPRDSVGNGGYRINALRVSLVSRDPSVVTVDSVITIPAGASSASGALLRPVGGGSTWIVTQAGGHLPDSVQVTVAAPQLGIYYGGNITIGAGRRRATADYVAIPNAISQPVTVTLTAADTTIAKPTRTVIIPAGSTIAGFAMDGLATGTTTWTASAPGYGSVTRTVRVVPPRVRGFTSTSLPMFANPTGVTVQASDSVYNGDPVIAPVTVAIASSDTSVAAVDSASVTIGAGQASIGTPRLLARRPGTAMLRFTAPDHLPDSVVVTVDSANLGIYYGVGLSGEQALYNNANYVAIPNARADTVVVTASGRQAGVLQVTSRISIAPGGTIAAFSWETFAPGVDTVTFTAEGYRPVTRVFRVSSRRLVGINLPTSLTTTSPPRNVQSYVVDSTGNSLLPRDTMAIRVWSTDTNVVRLDSAIVHHVRGQTYSNVNVARFVGPGTARLVWQDSAGRMAPDSSTAITITGPSLGFYYGGTMTVGMGQRARGVNYVAIPNAIATPLTVTLTSSAEGVLRSSVVTIPAGQTIVAYDLVGGDTTGLVRLTATATGYQSASQDVNVGKGQLRVYTNTSVYSTSPAGGVTVQVLDQAGNGREMADTLTVTFASSQPGVAVVDSASVRLLPGQSQNTQARIRYLGTGTTMLVVADPRTRLATLASDTTTVTVSTPPVGIYYGGTQSLGPGQYVDNYVAIPHALPDTLRVAVQRTASLTSAPDTVLIPAGSTIAAIRVTGVSATTATDTLRLSAPGHAPGTYLIAVGAGQVSLSGWPGTLAAGDSVALRIYTLAPSNTGRDVAAPVTFTIATNAAMRAHDAQGATLTTITVPAGRGYTDQFWVRGLASGTGTVTVSATGYATQQFNTAVP